MIINESKLLEDNAQYTHRMRLTVPADQKVRDNIENLATTFQIKYSITGNHLLDLTGTRGNLSMMEDDLKSLRYINTALGSITHLY